MPHVPLLWRPFVTDNVAHPPESLAPVDEAAGWLNLKSPSTDAVRLPHRTRSWPGYREPGARTARPGRAGVISPLSTTTCPPTTTYGMPAEGMEAFS